MKANSSKRLLTLLLSGAIAAVVPQWAAASTAPCTKISNTVELTYNVGGVGQDPASPDAPAEFYVGLKNIVAVSTNDGPEVSVTPGAPSYLTFTVQNNSNAALDFALALTEADGDASPFNGGSAGNDSFNGADTGTNTIYIESNSTLGLQVGAGGDTAAATINDLAGDGAGIQTVYIRYNPSSLKAGNAAIAVYYLTATSLWANGDAIGAAATATPSIAQMPSCDGGTQIDIVRGDIAGANGDPAKDGADTDASAFIVSTATIAVTKNHSVVWDPINLAATPKAIPGAVVRYTIEIENSGGASAILSSISDDLENALKIVSTANNATWKVEPVLAGSRTTNSGTLTADANAADGLTHTDPTAVAGELIATLTTILATDAGKGYAGGELKAGEKLTLTFDATIQ